MPMKVEELSDYVGINRSYFSDLFKQYTGMSPVKYLQNFHKIFRKTTGMSPNAYRQGKRQRTLSSQETMNNNRPDYIEMDDEL